MAEKNGYVRVSDNDLEGHFRCTNSSNHYDKKRYKVHRISWFGSANEFVVLVDEQVASGLINCRTKMKYQQFGKHFVNNMNLTFKDLHKKSNNISKSLTNYDYIKKIVWETLEFFGEKINKSSLE